LDGIQAESTKLQRIIKPASRPQQGNLSQSLLPISADTHEQSQTSKRAEARAKQLAERTVREKIRAEEKSAAIRLKQQLAQAKKLEQQLAHATKGAEEESRREATAHTKRLSREAKANGTASEDEQLKLAMAASMGESATRSRSESAKVKGWGAQETKQRQQQQQHQEEEKQGTQQRSWWGYMSGEPEPVPQPNGLSEPLRTQPSPPVRLGGNLKTWQVPSSAIVDEGKSLGGGSFGDVSLVTARGELMAFKKIRIGVGDAEQKHVKQLLQEAHALKEAKHENVIQLKGICIDNLQRRTDGVCRERDAAPSSR
jgi:hypothetical protein